MSLVEMKGEFFKEILVTSGFLEEFIDEVGQVLKAVEQVDDLPAIFIQQGFSADIEQSLLPLFRSLYQTVPGLRENILEELSPTEVPPCFVEEYLVRSGDQPGFVWYHRGFGEIVEYEKCERLFSESQRVMFQTLKFALCPQK